MALHKVILSVQLYHESLAFNTYCIPQTFTVDKIISFFYNSKYIPLVHVAKKRRHLSSRLLCRQKMKLTWATQHHHIHTYILLG